MRTTVTLDDDTARLLQEQVRRRGVTFKQAVNDALRAGLAPAPAERGTGVTTVVDMGEPTVDLTKALGLADDLEDAEIVRDLDGRR